MEEVRPEILVLAGPTAVGKTAIGIMLATKLNAEIISADSRQVYRQLDIGTGKPTPQERAVVPHHLVDVLDPDERYTAQRFAQDALAAAQSILQRGKVPLVVGGTGFYIETLIHGLALIPPTNPDVEARLARDLEQVGVQALHARLSRVDPETAARVSPNDRQRVLRALAVYDTCGRPLSEFHKASPRTERVRVRRYVVLTRERGELYARIEARVEEMISAGLVEEVKRLANRYGWNASGLQTLGYRQFRDYIDGRETLSEAIERLKRDTRRYAKRQLTWFRRVAQAVWVDISGKEASSVLSIFANGA